MKNVSLLLLSFVLNFGLVVSAHAQSKTLHKQLKEFDTYVESARKQWNAVGLAVTVVKGDEVIFKKGYGLRELNSTKAVDLNTLFSCGSTTKAMTATCMGILVDEGKINWNDPVIDYLPDFQLYDPYVTRELTIRDLFIHDSGVGNTDFLWAFMNISSEEILKRMRLVEPSYSFRSGFVYQNIFYLAAGKIIEQLSGQPWHQFIQHRIFQPLGMNRTVALLKDIPDEDQTKPHIIIDGKMTVIEDLSADAIGPAGSVWSSIDDISKWTKCFLDSGKFDKGRLVTPKTWIEMTSVQTIVPESQFYPTARITKPNWTTYGLGWFQHDYKGRKLNFHTGSLPGSIAIHGQLPEERIAVYVFGNTDHVEVRHAIMYKAFDLFSLGGTKDWSSDFLQLYNSLDKSREAAQKSIIERRVPNTKSSLPIAAYAGKYEDELYGEILIEVKEDYLIATINNVLKLRLDHWHYDTFRGPFEKKWFGDGTAQFQLDQNGKPKVIKLNGLVLKKSN